jgi:hypothetical protein
MQWGDSLFQQSHSLPANFQWLSGQALSKHETQPACEPVLRVHCGTHCNHTKAVQATNWLLGCNRMHDNAGTPPHKSPLPRHAVPWYLTTLSHTPEAVSTAAAQLPPSCSWHSRQCRVVQARSCSRQSSCSRRHMRFCCALQAPQTLQLIALPTLKTCALQVPSMLTLCRASCGHMTQHAREQPLNQHHPQVLHPQILQAQPG